MTTKSQAVKRMLELFAKPDLAALYHVGMECVTGDTWTMTTDGPRQVKDVVGVPTILLVNGKAYSTKGFFSNGFREVFEITTTQGYRVQVTENHPFLTDNFGLQFWKVTKDLTVGDDLVLNRHKDISWDGDGTYNEGYILGWLIGDGSVSLQKKNQYNNLLDFFPDEHHLVPYVSSLFDKEPTVVYREDGDHYRLTTPELEHLRIKFGLDKHKEINTLIEKCNSDFLSGFLSAFFDTDGCFVERTNVVKLAQSDLGRLEAVQRILLRFGITSRIGVVNEAKTTQISGRIVNCKKQYSLTISKADVFVFQKRIGFKNENKSRKLSEKLKNKRYTLNQKFTACVKSIKSVGFKNVFDVTVPTVNAFDANGFYVHNCQVNVAQDNGERVEGEYNGRKWIAYTDGVEQWKSFRIPFNAMTEPTYEDKEIKFDLAQHADAIGMTGWCWTEKVSKWVAFDFDAITGHSDKHAHKLSVDELKAVSDAACSLDWVTVRYSTSGKGLHLYVFVDDVPTANHTEHAGLARSILSKMGGLTGFDFRSKVDIVGGNMWVWARKMKGTCGLELIKGGSTLTDIPENWRDHIDVVRNKRNRVPTPLNAEGIPELEQKFDNLSAQHNRVKLDEGHVALIKYLNDNNLFHWWDADHHMLVTHTAFLKRAHDELQLRGIFETETKASTSHNCFAYPMRNAGWAVRRYSPGVKEHPSWDQDGQGWTRCYLNIDPTLRSASMSNGGLEHKSGAYHFSDGQDACKAAQSLGANVNIPPQAGRRPTFLKYHKDGRLLIEFEAQQNDNASDYQGWLRDKTKWMRMFNVPRTGPIELDSENYEDIVRHLITETGIDAGWAINVSSRWVDEPLQHVKHMLESMGLANKDLKGVIGGSIGKPWVLTTRPFQPEYPGDKLWNRYAPQFVFQPVVSDTYNCPTWRNVLEHIGQGLNEAVRIDDWCKKNGVGSGADYLKLWIASLFQYPTEPLPYLFLYSEEQLTGKSTFHEALSMLFNPGYQFVEHAVLSQSSFNAELEGTILCVIEETDLSNSKSTAYDRIKNWVTSPKLSIHRKNQTPYITTNTTHFIQCANERRNCPVFPGDTRIVIDKVGHLTTEIPKRELMKRLEKEAGDFLGSLLSLEIPDSLTRLRVPVIETQEKQQAQQMSLDALATFITEKCHYCPGNFVTLADFHEKFLAWLDPTERMAWTKTRVSKHMPTKYIKGLYNSSWCWGNIGFQAQTIKPTKIFYTTAAKTLILRDIDETH